MALSASIRIDTQGDDYVIRVRRDLLDPARVARFFDCLMLEAGIRKFDMSDEQIAAFAGEVDRAAWERVKPIVEEKLRGR